MPAIKAKNLSKQFVIGGRKNDRDSFREMITDSLLAPFRRFRRLGGAATPEERFWALKDVSFEVEHGETVGIIGKNGAGKSTLLKILSRVTEPTAGWAELDGRIGSILEVGTGFHPELTGRENIFLNGSVLGMSRVEIRKKFDEIVSFAEVEKFLDTPVKHYSSGMYMRLAFAVAAHLEPEILIVDEVLAVGDIQFQKKCLGKMEEAGKEGRTILFVSHNLTAIRAMCTRVLLIEDGKLVCDGEPATTFARYVGAPVGNLLVREWPEAAKAPQNASAILRKVIVRDEDGKVPAGICTDTPFSIEVEYGVKKEGASVGINLIFYDSENVCVLASINNHESNWYGKPMPAGIYRSVCRVPKNLLNNVCYTVSIVLFGKNYTDAVVAGEVVAIDVQDGIETRGDYFGAYACRIRPDFPWATDKVDA
ncbi:MAG: ATP-binding cassette domain-containing protein [Deltaproteobacteria bacterium]|nr:ATP-binding cassette domain-containing protein [Deltaproteobacteria bacterium]